MRLVFDENAAHDLERLRRWILPDSPSAAENVSRRLKAVCTNLLVFPEICKEGVEPGTRELIVAGLPYVVVYRINRERKSIVVMAIFHNAQDREIS